MKKEWIDERLLWDPSEHSDIKEIRIPSSRIWVISQITTVRFLIKNLKGFIQKYNISCQTLYFITKLINPQAL